jgi:hypothetical protein
MYDQMARSAIVPSWVRFYDFGTGRIPKFLKEDTLSRASHATIDEQLNLQVMHLAGHTGHGPPRTDEPVMSGRRLVRLRVPQHAYRRTATGMPTAGVRA